MSPSRQLIRSISFKAMGSPCSIKACCNDEGLFTAVADNCIEEVERLEKKYSRYIETSIISQINQAAGIHRSIELDEETWLLLQYADSAYKESNGLFDISSGSLRKIWSVRNKKVPKQSQIKDALKHVGWSKVELADHHIRLPIKGMEVDFGGIVKEYAADKLGQIATHHGIDSAIIELGGDIAIGGANTQIKSWKIGISDPANPDKALATTHLTTGGLASSGNYERFFSFNGKRYSHLLNPKTGWPVQGLTSVSVLAPLCVLAGSISTIAMLKPEKAALKWLQSIDYNFFAIDSQGKIHTKTC